MGVGLSESVLERMQGILLDHVARGYASGVVALVGDGERVKS